MNGEDISDIPEVIRRELTESLTSRGIRQWWESKSRYLSGRRPCDYYHLSQPAAKRTIEAANAFAEGTYL